MKLNEISGLLCIDVGAPTPTILSNDNNLYLMFYSNEEGDKAETLRERNRNNVYDRVTYVLKFNLFIKYRFGMPNNEIIIGHPYFKLGLKPNSFYQLEGSDWIKELMKIDSVHPYFNEEKWTNYKHYIFTFHDNMFECIAKDYEISESTISIYKKAITIINEMIVEMH